MITLTSLQLKIGIGIGIVAALALWWTQRDSVEEDWILFDANEIVAGWCLTASPIHTAYPDIGSEIWPRDYWIEKLQGNGGSSMTIGERTDLAIEQLGRLSQEGDGDSGLQAVLWDLRVSLDGALTAVYIAQDAESTERYVAGVGSVEAACARMQGVMDGMLLGRR